MSPLRDPRGVQWGRDCPYSPSPSAEPPGDFLGGERGRIFLAEVGGSSLSSPSAPREGSQTHRNRLDPTRGGGGAGIWEHRAVSLDVAGAPWLGGQRTRPGGEQRLAGTGAVGQRSHIPGDHPGGPTPPSPFPVSAGGLRTALAAARSWRVRPHRRGASGCCFLPRGPRRTRAAPQGRGTHWAGRAGMAGSQPGGRFFPPFPPLPAPAPPPALVILTLAGRAASQPGRLTGSRLRSQGPADESGGGDGKFAADTAKNKGGN